MIKGLHSRTLLIVAALTAACGEPVDDYDDQTDDPANVGGFDAGAQQGGDAGADAARGDGSVPSDPRFDGGGGSNAGDAGADASPTLDAAPNGNNDAGSGGGGDAAVADAGADAGRDASAPDASNSAACSALTYEAFGRAFLTTYCVSCHGSVAPRGGVRLDSLAGITARKANAKSAVLSGAMPQGSNRPSNIERDRFGQWMDCGPN